MGQAGTQRFRIEEGLHAELYRTLEPRQRVDELRPLGQHPPYLIVIAVDGGEAERQHRRDADAGGEDRVVLVHLQLEPGGVLQVRFECLLAELGERNATGDRGELLFVNADTGETLRSVATESEPMDLLVAAEH